MKVGQWLRVVLGLALVAAMLYMRSSAHPVWRNVGDGVAAVVLSYCAWYCRQHWKNWWFWAFTATAVWGIVLVVEDLASLRSPSNLVAALCFAIALIAAIWLGRNPLETDGPDRRGYVSPTRVPRA